MEAVSILGAVRLSEDAYLRFCSDHGHALIEDIKCSMANADAERSHALEIAEFLKRIGEPSMSQLREFIASHRKVEFLAPCGYFHHPRNRLIVRYLKDSATLFYFYILELRSPEDMAQVPSFKTLQRIARYKDLTDVDHVVFVSGTPDVVHARIWRAFRVTAGHWGEVPNDTPAPAATLETLHQLAFSSWLTYGEESDDVGAPIEPSRMLSEPLLSMLDALPAPRPR